mmetsp:Transcript_8298/g.14687  ORF Transcript_8298/g.14687 Transcript_8298/m.14687 type:complete len:300 (+) Transcript_8298:206-1105(+)
MTDSINVAAADLERRRQTVKVSPVVLFSVLDHHIHRNEEQQRVIGALLGTRTATTIVVKNCFPVPHVEQGEDVAVGKDFLKHMLTLHEQVNSNEEILGWYATCPSDHVLINKQSCLIQDFFSNECFDPVHMLVDTSLTNNVLDVKAFLSDTINLGPDGALAASFGQLKVELVCNEPERIALDFMIKSANTSRVDTSKQIVDSKDINSEIQNLEQSVERLLHLLENVEAYVDDVVAKRREPDHRIGSRIASVVSMVPRIKPDLFAKSFRNNLQDLLMVVYLSNMTRTQLAVAERIGKTPA